MSSNDANYDDRATGEAVDNDYTSRSGEKNEPNAVVSDNAKVEDPIDARTADSDATLGTFSLTLLSTLMFFIPSLSLF